ncbi:MAG: DUF1127 domain-containing protein [Alphaproteobacteria bacterium]|nr:DUF1127 domain-containing protein [Alphaproteobacteria bacterium]
MSFQSRQRLADQFVVLLTPASPRRSLWRRLLMTRDLWRERIATRRYLAALDARSLRDAGISPAAAAYEASKPFWRPLGALR